VAGTNSAQWSFRHKIVDKQFSSASLGVLQFFSVLQLLLLDYVKILKRRNFLLNETKIILWQENDWKVRFPEYESDNS